MATKKDKNVLTVSQLNEYVKMLLENSPVLTNVYISGEISNLKFHTASGHLYFTLKDELSGIKAVMFRSSVEKLKFMPENGMNVIVNGRISAYVRDGVYQIYVSSVTPQGVGDIALSFEQLKEKLRDEGLFDEKHKKAIPRFPHSIGVITSAVGAAIKDIINVTSRRYPLCELVVYPALVQGEGAEKTLVEGVEYFSKSEVDLIIIGRGGGSGEDLQAFNSEKLARAIFASSIPVISAVGHEHDYTICDFVSDLRAPTPSAAAELAVPDKEQLYANLQSKKNIMINALNAKVSSCRDSCAHYASSSSFNISSIVIKNKKNALSVRQKALADAINATLALKRSSLSSSATRLDGQSPLAIFAKGYALVSKDGTAVRCADELSAGDDIELTFSDGKRNAVIVE